MFFSQMFTSFALLVICLSLGIIQDKKCKFDETKSIIDVTTCVEVSSELRSSNPGGTLKKNTNKKQPQRTPR